MDAPVKGLSCSVCKLTPQTGLQAILAPCGATLCQNCADKSEVHCQKCQDQQRSQKSQKTVVLHNLFTNFQLVTVSLPCTELDLATPVDGTPNTTVREIFDCPICFDLIFDPVTVNCGHSFCRSCLARAIDHNPVCPVCRAAVPQYSTQFSRPTDILIQQLSKLLFSDDFFQREAAELKAIQELENELPIFVCMWAFPKIPCHLHVFEPRYRLMMRRAMEGQRVFGMVSWTARGSASSYGTLLRIEELKMLPDGRSLVQAIGVRKFRIDKQGEKDGYMTGQVEWIDDDPFEPNIENQALLESSLEIIQTFLESVPVRPRYQLVEMYGTPPKDIQILSYWIVSVLGTSLPDIFIETFYSTTDPIKRLHTAAAVLRSATQLT